MAERSRRPLASFSKEWKAVPQTLVEIPATKPAASAPAGMVRIPEGDFDFQVSGIEVEGGNDPGVDVQYPWENGGPTLSPAPDPPARVLSGPDAGDQRRVQEISGCDALSPEGRSQLSAHLEERRLSRWLGQQARHLGVDRGRARLCRLGGQAPAARVGVAVRGPVHRPASRIRGATIGARTRCCQSIPDRRSMHSRM